MVGALTCLWTCLSFFFSSFVFFLPSLVPSCFPPVLKMSHTVFFFLVILCCSSPSTYSIYICLCPLLSLLPLLEDSKICGSLCLTPCLDITDCASLAGCDYNESQLPSSPVPLLRHLLPQTLSQLNQYLHSAHVVSDCLSLSLSQGCKCSLPTSKIAEI